MEQKIIGREYEFGLLEQVLHSSESELVVVYGRRRVGKTFLVNQFFDNRFAFKLTGVYDKPESIQLERFAMQMEEYGFSVDVPDNWFKAFDQLKNLLKQTRCDGKKVVFIDEMPWLDSEKSDFVAAFEQFWNGWASAENDILLIACGSATSWMTDKLLANQGGLFNRCSLRIFVRPFTLRETEQYLLSKGIVWTRYDIAECYMIMGGIPFYLKQLNPQLSYAQNIDDIFFREKGLLWDEFNHLYDTLFKQPQNHIAVVEALSKKRMGLTRNEIIEATKLHDNGNLKVILENLVNNEFIRPYNYFGKERQDTIYQLTDFYSMFYFSYVKNNYGRDPHYWSNSIDDPSRRSWAGYTFEQLCLYHLEQLKRAMGIAAVQCNVSSWFHKLAEGEKRTRGAQIDLIIDRRDRIINLCEMKFSINEFSIDKDYDAVLRNKIETFREDSKTKKALQLTMITTYGVKRNMYSNRVQSEVVLDDLFL